MAETYKQAQETIAAVAADSFAAHQITVTKKGDYLCRRPGTGVYHFFVILRPGAVIVYGDIGDGIFLFSDADALKWLRGAVRSPGYLLEKLVTKTTDFYPGDAIEFAEEHAKEYEGKWREVYEWAVEANQCGELHAGSWGQQVYDEIGDAEACSIGTEPSSRCLWLVEALKWFVGHVDQPAADNCRSPDASGDNTSGG